GGRLRRDRPGEERLPVRRRDRRPGARARPRPAHPGPDQPRPDDPRAGGEGPDEDEGGPPDDADLASRPVRRLRPAGRGARRVTRDLFTGDFERALVDNDQAYKRITGYLKKTSPHMVERVIRYKEKTPLMEAFGVEAEIKSTLNRRVDLPSGGYLIFDYAEAFTVIDVNTGRFVGSRGKSAGGRLEDTITKNNLEAVKEVVRQLRLRDIGGIIVIDFIDMANPKNR